MTATIDKAHSEWSASATIRNWSCPGSLTLNKLVAKFDNESEAAAWGTACHDISERALKTNVTASEFIGELVKTKKHEIEVTDEMAVTAQEYIDYVRGRVEAYNTETGKEPLVKYEQQLSLAKLNPPFEAGGTADCVMYFEDWRLLEVVDLKGGRGVVVEVLENKQARSYALAAMLNWPGLDVMSVMSTIVQPRASHKDGVIRSETYHVADLLEWTVELLAVMNKAKEASAAHAAITGGVSEEEWAAKHLLPGDHCDNTFCGAREASSGRSRCLFR
jgi:hypothetical protein